jgi:hypothetical protein
VADHLEEDSHGLLLYIRKKSVMNTIEPVRMAGKQADLQNVLFDFK